MHKKIGIIGGLSPESTSSYYLYITREYTNKFGSYGYPEILIYSVNLENFHEWRKIGRWDIIADNIACNIEKLKSAGADFAIIATNTMHKVYDEVEKKSGIPLINIIDSTAEELKEKGCKNPALLGTEYTMNEGFYHERMEKNGYNLITPDREDGKKIHKIIVEELVRGKFTKEAKTTYLEIIKKLVDFGADGIILGCTEIPLLITEEDTDILLFDTASIHAKAALKYSLF